MSGPAPGYAGTPAHAEPERPARPTILLAGALPGHAAGNAVSSTVLLAALRPLGSIGVLSHYTSAWPQLRLESADGITRIRIGTQPFSIHGEALLAGRLHRKRLAAWSVGWVVNSRYAGSLHAAGVPYALWEATTTGDELQAVPATAIRRAGIGSGLGRSLHRALLPIGQRIEGMLYRRAAALFAMSEYTRELMIVTHGLEPRRVRVLPHPPSPEFLDALARRRSAARRERDPHGPLRLLFVGRADDPRKNFGLLLDAFRRLRSAGSRMELTVVGPHQKRWRESLGSPDALRDVHFAGRVDLDTLVDAYLEHDLVVIPSRQEGFGIVVAEALHAGVPVISTRCGGPEAVLRASGAGVLVDQSAESLTDGIRSLSTSRARRLELGRRGQTYARGELSFEHFCARVAEETAALRAAAAPHR